MLKKAFEYALTNSSGKPLVVIAKTIKGKGVCFMDNSVKWHYTTPNGDELIHALSEIENA
jgi:transketolase